MDVKDDPETSILEEIRKERDRQRQLAVGGDTDAFDRTNTRNDWVAHIAAYLGRASARVVRDERENQTFRDNLVKAGALLVAAIRAHDLGLTADAEGDAA